MMSFDDFMRQREAAARAFCSGNAGPIDALSTDHDPATLFTPGGGVTKGAAAIKKVNREEAGGFGRGGDSSFEILHMAADREVAFWTGILRASVELSGRVLPMNLRVSEFFRREEGQWKLIHRHESWATLMT